MKQIRIDIPLSLESIVGDLKEAGGMSYLVGGALVDFLQGRPIKDWDIEVYGLSMHDLEDVLRKHGIPNTVGKSFGIVKLSRDGEDYDFSIPRRENKIGVGHRDFEIEFDPNMTPKEAAARRDLTINSMFYHILDGKLEDPYNGAADLEEGVIRHTSKQFSEDPLRVLRIMQLLPRKGRVVAPETIELCAALVQEYPTIPKERVFEEWNKLLMKAEKPSSGLRFLVDCGWIKWYPELDALRAKEQNPSWHPEGSVWNHTLMVIDNAAYLRKHIPEEWRLAFMYGALLHDVGKAVTTTEDLTSYGHDTAGVPIAESFMQKLTNEKRLTDRIAKIVRCHMRPGQLYRGDSKNSGWKRLHNEVPLNVIGYISKADFAGGSGMFLNQQHPPSEKALKLYELYGQDRIAPVLMGRDLVEAGYRPGHVFTDILNLAYKIQIDEGIGNRGRLLERVSSEFPIP